LEGRKKAKKTPEKMNVRRGKDIQGVNRLCEAERGNESRDLWKRRVGGNKRRTDVKYQTRMKRKNPPVNWGGKRQRGENGNARVGGQRWFTVGGEAKE